MSTEGQTLDQKSLRYALGKHEDADGLACDCVGLPMDKEGLNQRIFVHSFCPMQDAVDRKDRPFRDLAMCTKRANQAAGFGQNGRLGVHRQRWSVRNGHEKRLVHGNVNADLSVTESRPNPLFDGYLMADPRTVRQTRLHEPALGAGESEDELKP